MATPGALRVGITRAATAVVITLAVVGCRAPVTPSRASSRDVVIHPGPCCEREEIHDLFATPYRRAER